jgi:hypothetical protein
MPVSIYLRRKTIYIPTDAITEAGYHTDIEPIAVIDASDVEGLRHVLKERLTQEPPIIPTPPGDASRKPDILRHAKVSSWATFTKGLEYWHLAKSGPRYVFLGTKKVRGGWDFITEKNIPLGPDTDIEQVINNAVAHILQHKNTSPTIEE